MSKKILSVFLGASIILSTFSPLFIPKAKAFVVTGHVWTTETNPVLVGAAKFDILEWIKSFALSTLKKRILDVMVDQIITNIQGGGKPQFVTDWSKFLEDAGQAAVGDFAREIGAGFLCEPFNLQVQLQLLQVKTFSQKATCTLDKIVGNINNFYRDFRNGGWIAFGTGFQPQNNYFGALIMAAQTQSLKAERAALSAYSEAQAGSGFLSTKKCDIDPATGKEVNCVVVTPGSTVAGLVTKAVGSDFDFIVNAEQLGDYVASIVNALVNRLFTQGLASVTGGGSSSATNAASALYSQVTATAFDVNKRIILGDIDGTLVPRQQAQTIIDSLISSLNKFKDDLLVLHNEFSTLSNNQTICSIDGRTRQIQEIKDLIMAERAKADVEISGLQSLIAGNKSVMDPLAAFKVEILALQPNDAGMVRLSTIENQLSTYLNGDAAGEFKTSINQKQDELNAYMKEQLDKFNDWLDQCN